LTLFAAPAFAMLIKMRIPVALRQFTANREVIEVDAADVAGAIAQLHALCPGIAQRILDEQGAVRRFVNVYVNQEDIRFLQDQRTPLQDGDEVSIIPAIAGG
jgi:molybdopterin synthase sulfur carrier subunit